MISPAVAEVFAGMAGARRKPPIVLIDGGSGSGKTTLARDLVAAWPSTGDDSGGHMQLIRLDDLYPGWDGLAAGSSHVLEHVLEPLSRGRSARWQRWDWTMDAAAEWHDVDPAEALVIEGSGALSRANRTLATLGVWVHLDAATRKRRALDRDGELYAPHWDRWAAQEAAFAVREHPRESADVVLDGIDLISADR